MNWRLLVGAAALVLGLAACGDDSQVPLSCDDGTSLCGGSCADTETDARNCGACGITCGEGALCVSGACIDSCPTGQLACDGGCFTVETSADHCGSCGNACAAGEACADGQCVTSCPSGQDECGGGCYDLDGDRENCGACGTSCGEAELCIEGACEASCPANQVICDGACVDLDTTRAHCGACGTSCEAGAVCVQGSCEATCAAGTSACDGTCSNLETDAANCGACGNACGDGQLCNDGSCELVCANGLDACDGSCRDIDNDRNNCGACGNACEGAELCSAGSCVPSCGGFASDVCDGSCTNLNTDPTNCGACGTACGVGEVCNLGTCAGVCAPILEECGAGCTDLDSDPANCGGCGNTCAGVPNTAAVCSTGDCNVVCLDGHGDCDADLGAAASNGCEATLATSADHCGGCGITCPEVSNGTRACLSGICGVGQCAAGFDDCDGQGLNGCEARLADDLEHCGACGNFCNDGQYCGDGQCIDQVFADTCATDAVLTSGPNEFHWHATQTDYITTRPCGTVGDPDGPDIVLKYVSQIDGQITLDFTKPSTHRWYAVVTAGVCEDISASQAACWTESNRLAPTFPVSADTTYYVHVVDSTSGTQPLSNPLLVDVAEFDCGVTHPVATTLHPANGGINSNLTGTFRATFNQVVDKTAGTFILDGDKGTRRTFASNDAAVTFAANGRSVSIMAGDFSADERVTVSWTGLADAICGKPIPTPAWTVTMPIPPCTPGMAPMLGSTVTAIPSGLFPGTSLSEIAVAADGDPNGFVYVAGTSNLYRFPKAGGGRPDDIYATTSLSMDHLGYHLFFEGQSLFSLKSRSGDSGILWRLTADNGTTWDIQDAAHFPVEPGLVAGTSRSTMNGAGSYGGKVFMITHGAARRTEIWSVDVTGALPAVAEIETTFATDESGLEFCGGMAADAAFFYTTCRSGNVGQPYAIIRIDRTTGAITELGTSPSGATMGSPIHAVDTDADGRADFLYQKASDAVGRAICAPSTSAPYTDELFTFEGSTSGENGLAYDPALKVLWLYDSTTRDLLQVR